MSDSNKSSYLYILHSKDFDIDGPDTCYKFGYTNRIEMRKFNSCYRTALKYPPTYKYWYEIHNFSGQFLETLIKRTLVNNRYIGHNGTEKTHGTEMFCIHLNQLRQIVLSCLKSNQIEYTEHDTDNFARPTGIDSIVELHHKSIEYTDDELNQIVFIYNIIKKINKMEKLDADELRFIKDTEWIYNHHKSSQSKRCVFCNRKLETEHFSIYSEKFGIYAFIGGTCIKKIKTTVYVNTQVTNAIEEMGFNANIIKSSTSKIANIINDASHYIYNFLMNNDTDETSDASSSVIIDDNILRRIFNHNDEFSPLSAICMIVTHMYRNSYTYISKNELVNEIQTWNNIYEKYWDIDLVARYLFNNTHNQLRYDPQNCIFILTKYETMEKLFINQWKLLDVPVDDTANPTDMKIKFIQYLSQNDKFKKALETDKQMKKYLKKQCKIFDHVATNKISILSGIAGSGKSTLSSFICREYSLIKYNIIQLAPTGKAVSVIKDKNKELQYDNKDNVSTIHSFLLNTRVQETMLKSPYEKIIFHIDETSMVDIGLFVKLLTKLIEINKSKQIKILISGDHDQLPPVGFGHVFKYLVETIATNMVKLDKNMRNECNLGRRLVFQFAHKQCHTLEDFLKFTKTKTEKWNNETTPNEKIIPYDIIHIKNLYAYHYQFVTYNNKIANKINNIIKGTPNHHNQETQPDMKKINIGDRIMILKNGYDDETEELLYYNGEEGIVSNIITNNHKQITELQIRPYTVKHGELIVEDKYKKITFTKTHLEMYSINQLTTYSWCKTIHKTQGDGFENVCLILDGNSIDKTLLNTALTRVKKDIVILYADGWLTRILIKSKSNNKSFIPSLYSGQPLLLDNANSTDKTEIKEKLISLLPKYGYDYKYKIEHDIPITDRDLTYLKKKVNTYWNLQAYNKFKIELSEYYNY